MFLDMVPKISHDKILGYNNSNPFLGKHYRIGLLTDGVSLSDEGVGPLVHIYFAFRSFGGGCILKIFLIFGVAVDFTEEELNGTVIKEMINLNFQFYVSIC